VWARRKRKETKVFSEAVLWILIVVLLSIVVLLGFLYVLTVNKVTEYQARINNLYKAHGKFMNVFFRFFARSEYLKNPHEQSAVREMIRAHCRMLMAQPVKTRSFHTLERLLKMLINREKFEEEEALLLESVKMYYNGQEEDW
jgi:hypothetical protein